MKDKSFILFLLLGGFFITNAIMAEFVGVKIFSLEQSLSLQPINLSLFGIQNLSFNLTAGTLMWPLVFIMTDIINEYFGKRGVRFLSFFAVIMIGYAYLMVAAAMALVPADFWIMRETAFGMINMDVAYNVIFSQGLWIIVGSIVAFLMGQLIDVFVFQFVKRKTGDRHIWLRATGSTLVSQFIDSFVVLAIAFGLGAGWSIKLIMATGVVNYIYKFTIALLLTPLLYLVHNVIDKYLGSELSHKLQKDALESSKDGIF